MKTLLRMLIYLILWAKKSHKQKKIKPQAATMAEIEPGNISSGLGGF